MHNGIVIVAGSGGRTAYCPLGSSVAVRVLGAEECRALGRPLFPLEWFFSITPPDGTEHLIPAVDTAVRFGPPSAAVISEAATATSAMSN